MTTTYTLTTTTGQIRLVIGDTDTDNALLTDEEIAFFYSSEGSVTLGAAAASEAIAAKYAANATGETIGDYAYTSKTMDHYLSLAKRLRDLADTSLTPAMDFAEMDLIHVTEDTE